MKDLDTLDLAVKEVANAIWRRVRLVKDIGMEKAVLLLSDLMDIAKYILRIESQDQYLHRALEIALHHNITIYDSLFIAQAQAKKAMLITSNKRQSEVASKLGVDVLLM